MIITDRIIQKTGHYMLPAFFAFCLILIGWMICPSRCSAEAVDVTALQEEIASKRSGLPYNLAEKPLTASSIKEGTIIVYTDSDMIEASDVVDGSSLEIRATEATATALYGEYTSAESTGTGWIASDTFFTDPSFEKKYSTVRRDPPLIYENRDWSGPTYESLQYTELVLIYLDGKKHQVIYATEDGYAIGWIKSEDYDNTLQFDGRPKQLVADGTYTLHNVAKNDGTKTYEEDSYGRKLTFVYYEDDNYYIIDESGRWLGETEDGSLIWNMTKDPDVDGLFKILRGDSGYKIKTMLTKQYVGMNDSGIMQLYGKEQDKKTQWRIRASDKMVSLTKPMVITQYDPEWCGLPYGTDDISGCIGAAGCGILSQVNAVYSLTGQYLDVLELVDFAVEKEYRIIGSGTSDGVFKAGAKEYGAKYGYAWDGSSDKISTLVKKLKKGDVAISHVEGHYVTIVACNEAGTKFLLLDSNYLPKRETSAFGDWVSIERLESGTLSSTGYFFYKQYSGKKAETKKKSK